MKISMAALLALASVCALTDAGVLTEGLESYGNEEWIDLEALDLDRQIRIEAILNEENKEFSLTETDINGGLENFGDEGWNLQEFDLDNQTSVTALLDEEKEEFSLTDADIDSRIDEMLLQKMLDLFEPEDRSFIASLRKKPILTPPPTPPKRETAKERRDRLKADKAKKDKEAKQAEEAKQAKIVAEKKEKARIESAEKKRLVKERIIFNNKYDFRYDDKLLESMPACTSEGVFTVPGNCNSFYRCYSRYEKDASDLLRKTFWRAMFECHAGHVFSATNGSCSPGKCSESKPKLPCKSAGKKSAMKYGGDCRSYYICKKIGHHTYTTTGEIFKCEVGQYFLTGFCEKGSRC